MKAIKYFFAGALMSVFSVSAMAQATVDDAVKAIKSGAPNVAQVIKEVQKANKKNPDALVQIGRAYLDVKDTLNTKKFADLADAASKHKSAAAFILLGDLAVIQDDGGKAAEAYQQAIYADKMNPTGYIKYANIYRGKSPEMAVETLEQMRQNCPDQPVDAYAAHIYYLSAKQNAKYMPMALESFQKADRSKLDKNQLTEFALTAFASQKNQLSLDIVENALRMEPRNAGFNRLAMYNCVELKEFDNALKYADALFNKSDSAEFTSNDYKYAALAHTGVKNHEEAINHYKKQLTVVEGDAQATVHKSISDSYRELGDMDNALAHYEKFLNTNSKTSANDWAGFGNIYRMMAAEQTGAEQEASVNKAVEIYQSLIQKFPKAADDYANFMSARTIQILDADQKKGLAVPYYQALFTSISSASKMDNTDKTRLMEACQYLGIYYFKIKDDNASAKPYFDKLIELDPENATAKQVLEILNK